tara:strand:+ start:572 stop:847 length:276 start_codon:yes stop_codon:yes gene_type:complete
VNIISIKRETIEDFKKSYPCSGIPESVDFLVCCFSDEGELVDYDAEDKNGNIIDREEFDHAQGLSALFDDALKNHTFTPCYGIISGGLREY